MTASPPSPDRPATKDPRLAPLSGWLTGGVLDWVLLLSLVLIWGSAFAALKIAATGFDAYWMVAVRVGVGALALGVVLGLRGQKLPDLLPMPDKAWSWAFLIGVPGMALPFLAFAWAAHHVDSAVLAILNGAAPLFTALLAHVMLASERLTLAKAAGIALGFIGLLVLIAPKLSGGIEASGLASLAAILGTAGYAIGNVATKLAPNSGPTAMSLMFCLTAVVVVVPIALLLGPLPTQASPQAWAAAVYLGLGPTALATIIYVWLIQRRGPVFVVMVTYMTPVFATLVGLGMMGERPEPTAFIALALILCGVALAGLKRRAVAR